MLMRYLNKMLVGLSLVVCSSVFAAPLVVDVAGIQSYGEQDDAGNTVLEFNIGSNATVTGISWDVGVTAFTPSWVSEIYMMISASDQTNDIYFVASGRNAPGTAISSGSADLAALDLAVKVGADGILRLEFFEAFDDLEGADGFWNFGTFTFVTDAVDVPPPTGNVPEPATGMLMGAGLALMGYTVRRRRMAAKAA